MGNDQSHIKGIDIDKKSVETTDFWSTFNGELKNENGPTTPISIFQGEQVVKGQLWTNKSPLERATRNYKLYRHPAILRFITSYEKGSVNYLVTERCKPLSMVLASQNDTRICLGLRNILLALIFLNEQANMIHLNVCMSSIYVSSSGWRLGGFEHLWTRKEVNQVLLERSQPYRYINAIDRDETKRDSTSGIETLAFGVFCEEILSSRHVEQSTIPNVAEFRKYCVEKLRHSNADKRPKLSVVIQHPYFNQDFVLIHSFLSELPLKNQTEKQSFFTNLVDRLRHFDETVIGTELIDLILSRIVLLDDTAKLCVLPFVLQPRIDCESSSTTITPVFSAETFTQYVAPKITQLFLVRDVQIRLILLDYFSAYMNYFNSKEVLRDQILPQLLLGIKDTNDELVAATLRSLSELIPILGSSVVIGSNRARIFADGKPNPPSTKWTEVRSITPIMNGASVVTSSPMPTGTAGDVSDSFVSIINSQSTNSNSKERDKEIMPERLSPDGADEGEELHVSNEQADDDDTWSDWETEQQSNEMHQSEQLALKLTTISNYQRNISVSSSNSTATNPNNDSFIKDIKDIDIKPMNNQINDEIDDFFKDMEPKIIPMPSSTASLLATQIDKSTLNTSSLLDERTKLENEILTTADRFAVTNLNNDAFDDTAWDNEASDWEN